MLHSSNNSIRLSTLVLSPYTAIVPAQGPRKDAKKSGNLDTRSIQNISAWRNWGDCWSHFYQATSPKLRSRAQLWTLALPPNHIICSLMDSSFRSLNNHHPSSLANVTDHQRKKIKGDLVDTNNRSHGLFPAFLPTHSELAPSFWIIDTIFVWKGKATKLVLTNLTL